MVKSGLMQELAFDCPYGVQEDIRLPSVPRMAVNFAKAVAKDILHGLPRRSDEEIVHILTTHCQGCELVILNERTFRCSHQGCGCHLASKASKAEEHCPVGKW